MSMPYIGLLPFLRPEPGDLEEGKDRVNALYRASPISTGKVKKMTKVEKMVSMPYIGLLPFLLSKNVNFEVVVDAVSMPYIGLLLLLLYPLKNLIKSMVSGTVFRG